MSWFKKKEDESYYLEKMIDWEIGDLLETNIPCGIILRLNGINYTCALVHFLGHDGAGNVKLKSMSFGDNQAFDIPDIIRYSQVRKNLSLGKRYVEQSIDRTMKIRKKIKEELNG